MTTYRKFFKPFITAPSGLEGVFSIVKVLTILSYYRVLPSEYENTYFFVFDDSIKKIRNATPIKARAEGKYFALYTESL